MEAIFQTAVTIVLFFAILGSLVVIHELGHFVTARLANVRVLEFGIGFPPRAKVLRSSGETLYTLNWLPIGGFVKLEGEDGDDTNDPRSFANAPLLTRLVILIAGVAMNLLAAFLIFFFIAWLATPLVGLKVPIVEPNSPAADAGLKSGDTLIALNGQRFEFNGERDILSEIRINAGNTIDLGVIRGDGTQDTLTVTLRTPEEMADPDGDGPLQAKGALGIRALPNEPWELSFLDERAVHDPVFAAQRATADTLSWFGLILRGLGDLVGGFIADPTSGPQGVAGPVGIATQIGDVFFNAGPILTLYVAGILSANLALVNALPFPPLDGGRMLVMVLKSIFGRRISLQAERLTYFVGFAFLMAFLLWVTFFDLLRAGNAT
jgi:regulator of sigma E protease